MQNHSRFASSRAPVVVLGLLAACSISCGNKSTPAPGKEPAPTATPSVASAAPSASAAAAVKTIPTLTPEKFAPAGSQPSDLYAVEGALMVTEGQRIGRIVDDGIEWVGKIPKGSEALGDNSLGSVHGRWPDSIGALYTSGNGRAPQPTYFPVTGKGVEHTVAPGGGAGMIYGVARVGESTIMATFSMATGVELVNVRGPKLARKMISDAQGGCKPGEVWRGLADVDPPAVSPTALEASPEGTLVSIGTLCEKRSPAAEVWDKAGKSRLVDLGRWWKKVSYQPSLLKGSGDELWAFSDAWSPVLRYHDGAFEPVPDLDRPIQRVFTSPKGQLHGYDGQTIHRYEDGKWIPVARLAEPKALGTIAVDEKGAFWASPGGVVKLRESPAPAAPPEHGCKAWFVYLYQVSDKSEPNYTFPTTRKALSTFPEVSDLGLVDFKDGSRQLGVTVASRAQGEAVIAHVKANMKDEDPRLFCYEPKGARKVEIDPKGK